MIPYGRQHISEEDIGAVVEVLKSDFLTQGPQVPLFEEALCGYTGASYACVLNSATSALHTACLALGLGVGDILWSSAITYVASVNCAFYCGADIDLIDINPDTYNLSLEHLEQKLKAAESKNKLPKVVVVVHMAGQSCDMKAIKALVDPYGIRIIEDASHAIGGRYNETNVGGCKYSDITVFSFHPVKIVTCAEGGAALTNDKETAERMTLLRSHGITRMENRMTEKAHGPWYYQQLELGYNYRMTELQAALGLSQLNRLEEFVLRRVEIAQIYSKSFRSLPITTPKVGVGIHSSWHLYIIRLQLDVCGQSQLEVFQQLRAKGLGVNLHYIPLHFQPYIKNRLKDDIHLPQAEAYYKEAISLPLFPKMTNDDIEKVVDVVQGTLGISD